MCVAAPSSRSEMAIRQRLAQPGTSGRVQARRPVRCVRLNVSAGGKVYIDPVKNECAAFAPATVANLGPGFDWMGCAVQVRQMLGAS